MELRQLRHFVAVAEELHFARAAALRCMEQSPLSNSIQRLEAELGVRLFHRTTRRTWLTHAGARFHQDVRRILSEIDAAAAAVSLGDVESPNAVRLALGEDLASEPFTRLLFELEQHNPKLELDIRELAHTEAARLVRDGSADVAITLSSRSEPELKQSRGWSEPLMVVVPIGHPLAEKDKVSLRDLAGETLALPSADDCPGYLAQIEGLLHRHGMRVAERRKVRHWNTAVSFAATGRAIALCPLTMVQTATAAAVVPIEEEDAQLSTWLLYRDDDASPAVSLVLQIVAVVAGEPPLAPLPEVAA